MYEETARYYDLIHSWKDYEADVARLWLTEAMHTLAIHLMCPHVEVAIDEIDALDPGLEEEPTLRLSVLGLRGAPGRPQVARFPPLPVPGPDIALVQRLLSVGLT